MKNFICTSVLILFKEASLRWLSGLFTYYSDIV